MPTVCVASQRRGFTLVEVLVAACLSGMLLYAVVALLVPALRLSARGTTRVDLDSRALLLEDLLVRQLKSSCRSGVGVQSEGQTVYLTIHPLEGVTADCKQIWSDRFWALLWRENRLTEVEVSWPERPLKATVMLLPGLAAAVESAPVRNIVDGVTEFEAELGPDSLLHFKLTLAKDRETQVLERTVFLSNSGQ